jgi:hypothetical protein
LPFTCDTIFRKAVPASPGIGKGEKADGCFMNSSWIEAIIVGANSMANGVVKNISMSGLDVRVRSRVCCLVEERVTVDLYLRDSNRRYTMVKLHARVDRVDGKEAGLRFVPMTLSEQRKLGALIDFVSAQEGSERDRCEEALFTELLR